MNINVLSLFDGMSCGQIALEKLGFKINNYYASEIKDDAIKVTQHNYPHTVQLGDVTLLTEDKLKELPKIDLLLGGSPCQDLSIAMKNRDGLTGEKSKLFFEYVRIYNIVRPTYFLLENVSSMKKEDENVINTIMNCKPIKINSSLVSAQLRDRYYWTNIPNVQQPKDKNIKLQDILETGYTNRDKARCILESDSRPLTTPVKMYHRYQKFNTLVFKDKNHYEQCKNHYELNFKKKSAKYIDLYQGDLSVYNGIRYLTQTEVEKLQTVPAGYTSSLNRNEAVGLLGDGWTVDVIAHILSYLKNTYV